MHSSEKVHFGCGGLLVPIISAIQLSLNSSVKSSWQTHNAKRDKFLITSYIAQYQVLKTVDSVLHFKYFPGRPVQSTTCSYSNTYPPLSITRYSFIQLSELEQRRVKTFTLGLILQHRIRSRVVLVKSAKI